MCSHDSSSDLLTCWSLLDVIVLRDRDRSYQISGVYHQYPHILFLFTFYFTASILGLALISGIIVAPFSLQKLGRKLTNQLSSLPALGGWALLVTAKGPTALLVSRSLLVST